jgi:hypothetical protein
MVAATPMAPVGQISAAPGNRPASAPAAVGPAKPLAIPAGALLLRLRDPASVREAMILREVLGPPKGLQAMYSTGWGALP